MPYTAFLEGEIIARGSHSTVASALRDLPSVNRASDLLIFDDETGRQIDLDLRPLANEPRPRGRPALGVDAKEVTLLPRHWAWLGRQRSGASAALRQLVEEAMRKGRSAREAQDAAYWFLSVMAGDKPKFEDAVREIYLGNRVGYDHFTFGWPDPIRNYGRELAFPDL